MTRAAPTIGLGVAGLVSSKIRVDKSLQNGFPL